MYPKDIVDFVEEAEKTIIGDFIKHGWGFCPNNENLTYGYQVLDDEGMVALGGTAYLKLFTHIEDHFDAPPSYSIIFTLLIGTDAHVECQTVSTCCGINDELNYEKVITKLNNILAEKNMLLKEDPCDLDYSDEPDALVSLDIGK